jgi:glycosyltransferase involved in cell wall biosynthesis
MRVLHITPYYEPALRMGGLAVFAANIARGQVRAGATVSVFTTAAGIDEIGVATEVQNRDGVEVSYFPAYRSRLFFSWPLLRACRDRIPTFDIVHLHGLWRFPSTFGGWVASRSHIPYIISPQGSLNEWAMRHRGYRKRPYWWALERRTVRLSCRVHFSTDEEASQARRWIGAHPAAVIPAAVELPSAAGRAEVAEWRAGIGVPPRVPLIGFLGRIHPVKGLDILVDALVRVSGAHLVIAGPDEEGTRDGLMRRAAAGGIANRVHWPGILDARARGLMLSAIDLFVLPSHTENFGLAAAEAMAAGVAVVVTPGVNLARLIADSGAGRVVPRDPEAMAHTLSTLLADAPARLAMGTAGHRLVEHRFNPQVVARQMLGLYGQCLEKGSRILPAPAVQDSV